MCAEIGRNRAGIGAAGFKRAAQSSEAAANSSGKQGIRMNFSKVRSQFASNFVKSAGSENTSWLDKGKNGDSSTTAMSFGMQPPTTLPPGMQPPTTIPPGMKPPDLPPPPVAGWCRSFLPRTLAPAPSTQSVSVLFFARVWWWCTKPTDVYELCSHGCCAPILHAGNTPASSGGTQKPKKKSRWT